jgi:hypothetical protein
MVRWDRRRWKPVLPAVDHTIMLALPVVAVLRFWNLNHPTNWFSTKSASDRRHYLHGETFLDPHPPSRADRAGDRIRRHPGMANWRRDDGAILCGVTLLARRRCFFALRRRLAASFVLSDGFFPVDSRIAGIDIVYLMLRRFHLLMFRLSSRRIGAIAEVQ